MKSSKKIVKILLVLIVFLAPQVVFATENCKSILGDGEFYQMLLDFFDYIRIVGVGLVFVFTSVDFAKAMLSQNADQFKKSSQTAIKRLALSIAIFLLPILLNIILSLLDNIGGVCM